MVSGTTLGVLYRTMAVSGTSLKLNKNHPQNVLSLLFSKSFLRLITFAAHYFTYGQY